MKIIEKVLKNKLASFGFNVEDISNKLNQMNFELIEKQISNEMDAENYITVRMFDEPTVEISRLLINYNKFYIQNLIITDNINFSTLNTSIGTIFPVIDYKLNEKICIIATTITLNIEILMYSPSESIKIQYANQTYEGLVSKERDNIAKEYYDAFVENGRVHQNKVKSIMALLLAEHIIDEMAITGENPKIKMYDNPDAYAENITEYKLKYINRKTNRIELAYHPTNIKRLGANVYAGVANNDPYIKLNNLPKCADFPLNSISCYWTKATKRKKDEVSIYIATKNFDDLKTYKEYYEKSKKSYNDSIVSAVQIQLEREIGKTINKDFVLEVLEKLNPELINPPMTVIRDCMSNPNDEIEILKYRFKAIANPSEFEEKLYISIEDNIGTRYKYKIVENVLDDLTRIGNKLEYTDQNGNVVRKQSVADFNINGMTAIIRRETLIDYSNIKELLGYIYEDMEYYGTDMLPVPSIEVDFFFPVVERKEASMYNGTNLSTDFNTYSKINQFNLGENDDDYSVPGTTYATVKCVDSTGKILKENIIKNLYAGTPYIPEIIPVISDEDGKEWVCDVRQFPTTVINMVPEYNIIEIKYREKYSKVTITLLNRDGKKICDNMVETVQTGSTYDLNSKKYFTDENNNNWELISSRPEKLIVKDDDYSNNLILTYDIRKESVIIKLLNPDGQEIFKEQVVECPSGKIYEFNAEKVIIDSDGRGWKYEGKNPIEYLVKGKENNIIEVQYDVYKVPVITKYQTEDGISIMNDNMEFVQVGMPFEINYEDEINDIKLRIWKYKKGAVMNFVASEDADKNVINIVYEPKLVNVFVQMINETGNNIISPITKLYQIGEIFSSNSLSEITDNYGRMWEKKEEPYNFVISQNEMENNVAIKYQPLITTITVKYFDDERNELILPKTYQKQVGTLFNPEIIKKLESDDGRKWIVNTKEEEVTVKKNKEENIVSIFYEKELTDIVLEFYDAFGKRLKDDITIREQIGSIYNPKHFDTIEDYDGIKWMLENTEPKKMVIKENNTKFKLMYGEVKAIVIVKHININTNQTIIDDVIAKVKLGGVYVPNIQENIYDKEKYLWKYVGDKNFSLVVNENEQKNIILLQYDEATTKIHIKYQDHYQNSLKDEVIYDLQIGKKIDTKRLNSFIDINGIGWNFESTKSKSDKAIAGENEVINIYSPLKVDVFVRFLNNKGQEIINSRNEQVQIGRKYKALYDNRVSSKNNLLWQYKSGAEEEIKVSKDGNTIDIIYEPVYSDVTERYINKSGEIIKDELKKQEQVGSIIKFEPENILTDSEERKWNFVKIDRSQISILEDGEKNIVNEIYEERKSEVTVKVYDEKEIEIYEPKKYFAQVGSKFKADVPNSFIDSKTKLGWQLPDFVKDTIIVDEEAEKNVIIIKYDEYMVPVIERIVDPSGEEIIPDKEIKLQVGTTYTPSIEKEIVDDEGKEWYYGAKREKGLLLFDDKPSEKAITITVSETLEKNIILLKYSPLLAKVTVKYQDNLGNIIAQASEFEAQIGSNYTPEIKETIKDANKNKWTYNPNSKSSILVDKNDDKNVILLSYEEEKAPVIYKYLDEFKNRLKSPKKQLAQIGSLYTPEIENVIEDDKGKAWEYKSANVEKLEIKDNEQENVIEVIYIPLLVEVELNYKNRKGDLISTQKEKAQLGSSYSPNVDEKIFDDNSMMYKFVKCEPKELVIKEVPIGATEKLNVFDLTYEAVYSNVTIIYQDIDGNKIKDDEIIQLQVGTKYTPKYVQFVNDKKGIQWENISKEVDTIRVMENQDDNIVKMTFEVANSEIVVRYKDLDGNSIKEASRYQQNIGSEFIPKIEEVITDSKNRKWSFVSSDPVKLTVGSYNNIINMTYQEKKAPVVIKFETVNGKKLRADVKESAQEGIQYIPKKNFAIIYDENEIWRFLEFRPSSLLVTDNPSENVITQIYDNNVVEEEKQKPELVNPFANTLTEEEKKQDVESEGVQSDIQINENVMNSSNNNNAEKSDSDFTEPNLIKLSKNILLEESEKSTIIKLNDINKKIIAELDNFKLSFDLSNQEKLVHKINEYMTEEKSIIDNECADVLEKDKTGKRFLKVLEAIVELDKDYQKMQERKVILLTDYFVNTDISSIDQATYICERGKNEQELLIMQNKISTATTNVEELRKIYVELLYEKSMFDNYYKTRSKAKDEYFTNRENQESIGSEIAVLISKILPKQAFNLLQKNSLSIVQQNELEAIMKLLNSQQRNSLEQMVIEIKDSKLRKEITKKLKEL